MKSKPVSVFVIVLLVVFLTGYQKKTESCKKNTVKNDVLPAGELFTEPSELKAPSASGGSAVSDTEAPEKISAVSDTEAPEKISAVLDTEVPEKISAVSDTEVPEKISVISDAKASEKVSADQSKIFLSNLPEATPEGLTEQKNTREPAAEEQAVRLPGNKVQFGGFRKIFSELDIPPQNTVEYRESQKEEITRIQYVESVIDENDPNTYEIVEKQQEVPVMYVNQAGDIKYAYEGGIWYEYKYSSGSVTLGVKDETLALRLLSLGETYDGFEVISVDCVETEDENHAVQYQYYVCYKQICAMDSAPSEVNNLAAVDLGIVAATMTRTTEERIPVMLEEEVGTGEYHYYGWQEMEDGTFYFDENGEKVTGLQVIQGIRHMFDDTGMKISRSGVEVSEENGEIDWDKAAAARIDFAMIQCACRDSETGILLTDAQAERNLIGARQAGLETGICLRSQAVTEAEASEEAELLITMAQKYEVTGPVAITVSYANPEHNGRADGLGKEERTKYIAVCCQRLKEAGYAPVLHVNEAFLSDGLNLEKLSDCQLWLTAYGSELAYTGSCEIWQYTDKGTVNGISGHTGLNISYGK